LCFSCTAAAFFSCSAGFFFSTTGSKNLTGSGTLTCSTILTGSGTLTGGDYYTGIYFEAVSTFGFWKISSGVFPITRRFLPQLTFY